uniref:Uncharacterized protein n=1 Tax=Lepeophtheirus salmonis TaxID=72036 RepID=A0A0K2T0P8_LEPSM
MFTPSPKSNQYIIKIHEDIFNSPQNRIGESLECLGSVFKPKCYSQVLIKPKWGNYSCFTGGVFTHGYLIVSSLQVHFTKISSL